MGRVSFDKRERRLTLKPTVGRKGRLEVDRQSIYSPWLEIFKDFSSLSRPKILSMTSGVFVGRQGLSFEGMASCGLHSVIELIE